MSGETARATLKKSRKSLPPVKITLRRSSRNLSQVQKRYSEPNDDSGLVDCEEGSDVEEIALVDPLADSEPIILKDTRKLVDIAVGSRSMESGSGKKEPTFVIIDINSILADRGPIPISQTPHHPMPLPSTSRLNPGCSILRVGLPAQSIIYPKAGFTPSPPQVHQRSDAIPIAIVKPQPPPPPPPPPPPILPTLTDDMYVVEAPSFIVPYVYEKPPLKPLMDYIKKLNIEIERLTKLGEEEDEEEERKREEEKMVEDIAEVPKGAALVINEIIAELDGKESEQEKADTAKETMGVEQDKPEMEPESSEGSSNENNSTAIKNRILESVRSPMNGSGNDDITSEEKIMAGKKSSDTEKMIETSKCADASIKDYGKEEQSEKVVDKLANTKDEVATDESASRTTKTPTYFDNPLGKFFIQIGTNMVTEFVQTDLLRQQRRKRDREGKLSSSAQYAVNALMSNLELNKENNNPFHLPIKTCEHCNFKTDSALVMVHHLETPHMRNHIYTCSFCPVQVRNPHDILSHMEAEHNVQGHMDRAPACHQCPNCTFEDNQKGKLTRHLLSCVKKYVPEKNLEPPSDCELPAKITRVSRTRPQSIGLGTAAYRAMIAKQRTHNLLPKLIPAPSTSLGAARQRGRPTLSGGRYQTEMKIKTQGRTLPQTTQIPPGMLHRPSGFGAHPRVLLPTTDQFTNSQLFQTTSKLPSISITPLPRQAATSSAMHGGSPQNQTTAPGKNFVICEICDGYIKDLELLRQHMLLIHNVKIHSKLMHNRPPLNCQKCQCRFFSDRGLERHLLGTHGLVTSSMQEAANKGKDAGRCPACGRVYQCQLLNHVTRDHGMVLKLAQLSYKCVLCTATFGMYKQFEKHVYSLHSAQAKRVMDKKPGAASSSSAQVN